MLRQYLTSFYSMAKSLTSLRAGEEGEKRRLCILLVIVCLSAALPGLVVVNLHSRGIESGAYANLQVIASLKAKQIEKWIIERKDDGNIFFSDPKFIESITMLQSGDPVEWAYVKRQLEHIKLTYEYNAIILLNTKGQPIMALGEHKDAFSETKAMLPKAFATGEVQTNNIFKESRGEDEPYLDFIVPLFATYNGAKIPAGAVILHVMPKYFLFPFIQEWPTASSSGETLLVRRDGDDALFLNELRFQKKTSMKLRIPLHELNLPATVAINDAKPGVTQGHDYRKVEVLAAYRPVAGTDWFIIAKMDRSEVLSPLYLLAFLISFITLIALLILMSIIILFWHQQKRMYHMEIESQTLKVMQETGRRFWALTQSANDAIITSDEKGIIADWNPGAKRLFGYSEAELVGESITRIMPERFQVRHLEGLARLVAGGKPHLIGKLTEFAGLHKNGQEFPIELSAAQWKNNNRMYFTAIIRDISQRKKNEFRIARLSQLYSALAQCNEAIVRSSGKEELFPKICQIIVETGGMKMAWIGQINEKWTEVSVTTSFGDTTGYLKGEAFEYMRKQAFSASYASSIDFGKPVWFNNIPEDGIPIHREMSQKAGFGSSASIPVFQNEKVTAMLNVYSQSPNAFDDETRTLLGEIAMDISYAMDNFAREEERNRAVRVLAESEQRFRNLVEQPLAGVAIIQEDKLRYVNPRFAEIFGYHSADDLINTDFLPLIAEKDRDEVRQKLNIPVDAGSQSVACEFTGIRKDSTLIELGFHGTLSDFNEEPSVTALMQDITEKKQAEAKIQKYITQLQNVFVHTVEVVNTMSEMRDPYTAGHERRVADIAVAIGKEMGYSKRRLEGLKFSGLLHDLGKITLPAEMLAKPRKLTDSEYNLVKEHPQTGFDILTHVEFPWPIATMVLQHHERMDGTGYPFGLKGEEILFEARIIAVADVVEAMASHRPYRAGLGLTKALAEIKDGSGTLYDADIASACLRIFHEKKFVLPEI